MAKERWTTIRYCSCEFGWVFDCDGVVGVACEGYYAQEEQEVEGVRRGYYRVLRLLDGYHGRLYMEQLRRELSVDKTNERGVIRK